MVFLKISFSIFIFKSPKENIIIEQTYKKITLTSIEYRSLSIFKCIKSQVIINFQKKYIFQDRDTVPSYLADKVDGQQGKNFKVELLL